MESGAGKATVPSPGVFWMGKDQVGQPYWGWGSFQQSKEPFQPVQISSKSSAGMGQRCGGSWLWTGGGGRREKLPALLKATTFAICTQRERYFLIV